MVLGRTRYGFCEKRHRLQQPNTFPHFYHLPPSPTASSRTPSHQFFTFRHPPVPCEPRFSACDTEKCRTISEVPPTTPPPPLPPQREQTLCFTWSRALVPHTLCFYIVPGHTCVSKPCVVLHGPGALVLQNLVFVYGPGAHLRLNTLSF